ncbi:TPA: hypothetical protein VAK58_001824 [Klebsiella aerogenes]|nr:hypothetical protein [Klebsiella aerogenes]
MPIATVTIHCPRCDSDEVPKKSMLLHFQFPHANASSISHSS